MIIRFFKKCCIFVAVDGSEASPINIETYIYIIGKNDDDDEATNDDSDPFENLD